MNRWVETNKRLVREWETDVPWWYNERASLSVFAGAVWKTGGLAFEEFAADKRAGRPRRPNYHGRTDLYLKIRGNQFIAEAKYFCSSATRGTEGITESLQRCLDQACKDVRRCPPYGQCRLGMAFVMPRIPKSRKKEVDELVEEWIKAVRKVECSCCAWVFPKEARFTTSGKFYYPGAAVLIREA